MRRSAAGLRSRAADSRGKIGAKIRDEPMKHDPSVLDESWNVPVVTLSD
jgi:hypothetical protein